MVIMHTANALLHAVMPGYYGNAIHRQANTVSLPLQPNATPLHFFRGMVHFEPAPIFLQTLQAGGLEPRVFRYSPAAEKNRMRQWPDNTADALRHFIESPEEIGRNPIFAGHSAGGFTVFTLGALAKGGNIDAIRRTIPGAGAIRHQDLLELAHNLSTATFLGIASPLNGIEFKRTEDIVHRAVLRHQNPTLTRALSRPFLEQYYEGLGLHPNNVMDGTLVSKAAPFAKVRSLKDYLLHGIVQGGMRFLRISLVRSGTQGQDAIVPTESAWLEIARQIEVSMNHTQIVEEPLAAHSLLALIESAATALYHPEYEPAPDTETDPESVRAAS